MANFAKTEAADIMGSSITRHKLFRPYVGMALATLLFQIWVRSYECVGLEGCGVSFVKAAVWSVIWPASWVVYIVGLPWFQALIS